MNKLISFYFYLLLLYFNMLPKKKQKKIKNSVPPFEMAVTNKKIFLKKGHICLACHELTSVRKGAYPRHLKQRE